MIQDTSAFWDYVEAEADALKIGKVALLLVGKKVAGAATIEARVVAEMIRRNNERQEALREARREKERARKAAYRAKCKGVGP